MSRFALACLPWLVLSCAGSDDSENGGDGIARKGSVERAVPVANVAARDSRPLVVQQSTFLVRAFDAELAALELEANLAKSDPAQLKERAPRILADRTALSGLRQLAVANASNDAPPVRQLEPYDRFTRDMALDRLRMNAYTLGLVEPWVEVNQKFLDSKNLADRDLAIQARMVAFQSLLGGVPLRQAIISIEFANLKASERSDLFRRLKTAFPDAPLPVVTAQAVAEATEESPSLAGVADLLDGAMSGSSGKSGLPATLPRLDGSATPLGEIAPSTSVGSASASTEAGADSTELVKRIYVPVGTIAKQKSAANAAKNQAPTKPKQPQKPPR